MISVSFTLAKPSNAALPVSPEVATKITTLLLSPVLAIAFVKDAAGSAAPYP